MSSSPRREKIHPASRNKAKGARRWVYTIYRPGLWSEEVGSGAREGVLREEHLREINSPRRANPREDIPRRASGLTAEPSHVRPLVFLALGVLFFSPGWDVR